MAVAMSKWTIIQITPLARSLCILSCNFLRLFIWWRQNLFSFSRASFFYFIWLVSQVRLLRVLYTISTFWIRSVLYLRSQRIYSISYCSLWWGFWVGLLFELGDYFTLGIVLCPPRLFLLVFNLLPLSLSSAPKLRFPSQAPSKLPLKHASQHMYCLIRSFSPVILSLRSAITIDWPSSSLRISFMLCSCSARESSNSSTYRFRIRFYCWRRRKEHRYYSKLGSYRASITRCFYSLCYFIQWVLRFSYYYSYSASFWEHYSFRLTRSSQDFSYSASFYSYQTLMSKSLWLTTLSRLEFTSWMAFMRVDCAGSSISNMRLIYSYLSLLWMQQNSNNFSSSPILCCAMSLFLYGSLNFFPHSLTKNPSISLYSPSTPSFPKFSPCKFSQSMLLRMRENAPVSTTALSVQMPS